MDDKDLRIFALRRIAQMLATLYAGASDMTLEAVMASLRESFALSITAPTSPLSADQIAAFEAAEAELDRLWEG